MCKNIKSLIATVLIVVLILLYSCAYIYYNVDFEPLRQIWYIDFTLNILKAIWYIILFIIFVILLAAIIFS